MIQSVIVSNALGITICFAILISLRLHNKRKVRLFDKIYILMTLVVMAACLCEALSFAVDKLTFTGARTIALITNSILYICGPVCVLLWGMYVDFRIHSSKSRLKKIYIPLSIPATFISIASFASMFYPIFFSISADNVYERTDLVILPIVVELLYLVYTIIMVYVNSRKTSLRNKMLLPVILFIVPIFIATVVQFTSYGISVIWPASAISLLSVLLNMKNEEIFIDPLTGLYNRQSLWEHSFRNNKKKLVCGIMVDVDHFKDINDLYGHISGDNALKEITEVLLTYSNDYDYQAYRFGGDEFILVCLLNNEFEALEIETKIQNEFLVRNLKHEREYDILVSLGHTFLKNEDSIDDFIKRMDKEMYNQKRNKR